MDRNTYLAKLSEKARELAKHDFEECGGDEYIKRCLHGDYGPISAHSALWFVETAFEVATVKSSACELYYRADDLVERYLADHERTLFERAEVCLAEDGIRNPDWEREDEQPRPRTVSAGYRVGDGL